MFNGVISAAIYGAVRPYAANVVKPITDKATMLGSYSDNVVMIGALWAVGKFIKAARPIARTGIIVESAMIGGELTQSVISPTASGSSSAGNLFNGGGL